MLALNKKISEFLDNVCIHINCKTVHKDIREELSEHINELKEEYKSNGLDEEKALDLAISSMGNTDDIGTNLNRQHKPQTEWSLLILTAIITVIGGVVMYSSSQFSDGRAINFSRYIVFMIISIGTMTAFYLFDYTKLKKMSMFLSVSGILLLVITMTAGIQMNGVKRWLSIGSYAISVPELASLLFLIGFAGFLEKYRMKGAAGIIKLMIYATFTSFLLLQIPCMSTAFVMAITFAVMLLVAVKRNHFGKNKKIQFMTLFAACTVPAGYILFNIITNPYLIERLMVYLPGGKINSAGADYYQYMANAWLSLSNWFGKSDASFQGHGLDMMPNVTGEYVLVNVIATLGWAIGLILILLIGIFIVRMSITIKRVRNSYGFYLSLSACIILSAQFLFNILMNFGLFPAANFNMPFVSYGSTGYVINMAFVGMILSVWRRNNLLIYENDASNTSSQNGIVRFCDGKLTIDLKAWRQQ